jgi:hypothetical protein
LLSVETRVDPDCREVIVVCIDDTTKATPPESLTWRLNRKSQGKPALPLGTATTGFGSMSTATTARGGGVGDGSGVGPFSLPHAAREATRTGTPTSLARFVILLHSPA